MRNLESRVLAAESPASRLERWSFNAVFGLLGVVATVLLVAPTVIVVITSFTSAFSLKFPPPGYSMRWYQALLFDSPEIVEAAVVSFKVAVAATAISVLLAVMAALVLARRRDTWARLLDSVFMSPLMLPTLALGLSLLVLFNLAGTGLSLSTLVIGHIAITTPYILRTTTCAWAPRRATCWSPSRCR
jgi:putative spermidine/putrescine transport system permease protein